MHFYFSALNEEKEQRKDKAVNQRNKTFSLRLFYGCYILKHK